MKLLALVAMTYLSTASAFVTLLPQAQSNMCVGWVSWSPNANLLMMPCLPAWAPLWRWSWGERTPTPIQFANNPFFCATANGAGQPVNLTPCNGQGQQIFNHQWDGTIALSSNPSLCLDAGNGIISEVITLQPCTSWKPGQRFNVGWAARKRGIEERAATIAARDDEENPFKIEDVATSLEWLRNATAAAQAEA